MKTKKLQRLLNSILEDTAAEPFQPSAAAIQFREHLEGLKSLPRITRQKYVDLYNEFVPEKEGIDVWFARDATGIYYLFNKKPEWYIPWNEFVGSKELGKNVILGGGCVQNLVTLESGQCKKYKLVEVPE